MPRLATGPRWFHIVGVGGAGMNGIATLLVAMGHMVSGSDLQASPVLDRLDGLGVETFVGHDAANVGGADFVAFSSAVRSDNVELAEARRRGIDDITRAELLAAICRSRRTLAVSGTHGKTTTTAMLAAVLDEAGFDPGFLVGGELPGGRGGASWGSGQWFVVEADESDGSFLRSGAEGVVVTNVEADHLDYYGDEAAWPGLRSSSVEQAPGPRVVCQRRPGGSGARPGRSRGDHLWHLRATPTTDIRGRALSIGLSFELSAAGRASAVSSWRSRAHNVLNATAALRWRSKSAPSPRAARAALGRLPGCRAAVELRGSQGGVTYIDDYAHNPGKVRATLATARQGIGGAWWRCSSHTATAGRPLVP